MNQRTTSEAVARVLACFPDAKPTKDGWQARCPAHDDRTPSLSIGQGDEGRALLKCFAGCSTPDVLAAVGLTDADLMPPKTEHSRIVATYDYRDETKLVLFQVVRFEPKDFRQRQPRLTGGHDWNVKGVRVIPYRLPQLTADKTRMVVVVEGEKDADSLDRIGVLATCNAGGSGKWTAEHAAFLKDRCVAVVADKDEPGRRHAQGVAHSLVGISRWTRVLELPGAGKDTSDWIAAGGTKDELKRLILAAPLWKAATAPPIAQSGLPVVNTVGEIARGYIDKIRAGKAELISTGVGELDYSIGGGIEPGEIIVFASRPSHGKSMLGMQCAHVWTAQKRPCLFLSEEMSKAALGKRAILYMSDTPQEHWDHSLASLERDVQDYECDRAPCYVSEYCTTTAVAIKQMEFYRTKHDVQFVIVDYAQLLSADGKDDYAQVTRVSKDLVAAAKSLQVTLVMLCQLNRKIEERKKFIPIMSDLRGSGQIEQDADVIVFLVWPHFIDRKLPANEYFMYVSKNRNRERTQSVAKCRFEPSRQRIVEYRMPTREVAWSDADGERKDLF